MREPPPGAPIVAIPTRRIVDWDTFHDVFAEAFGFPGFYGRNLDAVLALSYHRAR
ncbi:MAG: barstar family protein [Myxococcales bacterium]|nr:barstar family protein [Myxococcales bacterium]